MHLSYHSSSASDHHKPVIARSLCPTPALQSDRFLGSSCPAVARCCFLCTCSLNQQSSSFLFSCHHNHLLTFHPDRTGTAPLCLPASSTSLPSSLRIFCVRFLFFFSSLTTCCFFTAPGRSDVVLSFLAPATFCFLPPLSVPRGAWKLSPNHNNPF
jgi:hypothetical protein